MKPNTLYGKIVIIWFLCPKTPSYHPRIALQQISCPSFCLPVSHTSPKLSFIFHPIWWRILGEFQILLAFCDFGVALPKHEFFCFTFCFGSLRIASCGSYPSFAMSSALFLKKETIIVDLPDWFPRPKLWTQWATQQVNLTSYQMRWDVYKLIVKNLIPPPTHF